MLSLTLSSQTLSKSLLSWFSPISFISKILIYLLTTGKENIVNKMESIARELGFNTPGREVERMFKQQEEEFFFPGPNQQEHEWADA